MKGLLCTSNQIEKCVKKVKIGTDQCLPACSGLMVTSLTKSESNAQIDRINPTDMSTYNQYRQTFKFPSGIKG